MHCEVNNCKNLSTFKCTTCEPGSFYCKDHGLSHSIERKHSIQGVDSEGLKALSLQSLKEKIKRCIFDMASDTKEIISTLKKSSHKAISEFKQMSKNLEFFKPFCFDYRRVTQLIKNVELIAQNLSDVKESGNLLLVTQN